jgi:hypothetical protein
MRKMVRVRSGRYYFYLDGKKIYIRIEGVLNQQFVIDTFTREKMDDLDFMRLVDCIYRKKIVNTDTLNEHLYSKFRLVPTNKRLI